MNLFKRILSYRLFRKFRFFRCSIFEVIPSEYRFYDISLSPIYFQNCDFPWGFVPVSLHNNPHTFYRHHFVSSSHFSYGTALSSVNAFTLSMSDINFQYLFAMITLNKMLLLIPSFFNARSFLMNPVIRFLIHFSFLTVNRTLFLKSHSSYQNKRRRRQAFVLSSRFSGSSFAESNNFA